METPPTNLRSSLSGAFAAGQLWRSDSKFTVPGSDEGGDGGAGGEQRLMPSGVVAAVSREQRRRRAAGWAGVTLCYVGGFEKSVSRAAAGREPGTSCEPQRPGPSPLRPQ